MKSEIWPKGIVELVKCKGLKKSQLAGGNQFAIYKHERGVELEYAEKQLHLLVRAGLGPVPPNFKSDALPAQPAVLVCCSSAVSVVHETSLF